MSSLLQVLQDKKCILFAATTIITIGMLALGTYIAFSTNDLIGLKGKRKKERISEPLNTKDLVSRLEERISRDEGGRGIDSISGYVKG